MSARDLYMTRLLLKANGLLVAAVLAGLALASLALAAPASAERRVALVMGMSQYKNTASLPNTTGDAHIVGAVLRRLKFEVIEGMDLSFVQMNAKFKEFGRASDGADVALFYYAGHGMQVANENYMVPVDAALKQPGDLEFETIKVDQVLRMMVRQAKIKILLLDSCRDNPLANELARSIRPLTRAAPASGLAQIDASGASGTVIVFATSPGSTALDGRGSHSPFTEALLEHLETPGLDIDLLLKRVRGHVAQSTGLRQQPWTTSSLNGEFFLRPALSASPSAGSTTGEVKTGPAAPRTASAEAAGETGGPSSTQLQPAEDANQTNVIVQSEPPAYAPQRSVSQYDMIELAREPADEQTEASLHFTPDGVRDIHVRLRLLGLYKGSPKRAFKRKSREALRAWQDSLGLPATGYLNLGQATLLAERTQADRDAWKARGERFVDSGENDDDGNGGRRRRRGGGDADVGDFLRGAAHGIGSVLPF